MKTMEARYPGICARTGRPIAPGDIIAFERVGRRSRAVLVSASEAAMHADTVHPDLMLAAMVDPELADTDPEGAQAAGAYLRRSLARGVSDYVLGHGGLQLYRNRRGRCEDAPCCGCCTV